LVVALGGLFALTLIAPWAWQRLRAPHAEQQTAEAATSKGVERPISAEDMRAAWRLPPQFAPDLAAPPPAEPTIVAAVMADDYVAVDEPLLIEPQADEPQADPVLPTLNSAAPVEVAAAGSLEPFRLNPIARSVLVGKIPAPTLPRRQFSIDSLLKLRDSLAAIVEQARQSAPPAAPRPAPVQVVVTSETDRLAMLPPVPVVPPNPPALPYSPTALIADLRKLSLGGPGAGWARAALLRVEELNEPSFGGGSWLPTVAELRVLADQGAAAAVTVADPAAQTEWLRAAVALKRRLPLWEMLVSDGMSARGSDVAINEQALMAALHAIGEITADDEAGAAWRTYLRFEDLANLASVGSAGQAEARRATARDVLARLNDAELTAEQRQFLAQPPVIALARELRPWAAGEVRVDLLYGIVEQYELRPTQRGADAIAELRQRMAWSDDPALNALAEHINREYRKSNLRVAFSSELINRMIPPQEPVAAPVREWIAGAEVRGRSQTITDVHVRLLPDDAVWRFGLEAAGTVRSTTYSDTWPAKVHNASQMEYEARKLILVNRHGLHVWPAESHADGRTDLIGVDTQFDRVPILGNVIENAARKQHHDNHRRAVAQVKAKVGREARSRMDEEVDARLAALEVRFREHVLEPLARLALVAEPVEMSTAENRAVLRLRMADQQQLAAHTPRPSAPSDSLASLQLHESALNNALRGLDLDGRRMSVVELHSTLSEKIRRHASAPPADLPAAAKVEFAAHDAVRISCQGDRIELILNIVELRHGRDKIRNVGVHAFFRPVVEGIEIKLVRDGTLQFAGAHLRTGPRLVLHSVFGKLLPKDQELPVLAAPLRDDPRFAGLMVTQLVIDDGWLAVSLGPATPSRVAWRTRGADSK
jgi:hypothetical protein